MRANPTERSCHCGSIFRYESAEAPLLIMFPVWIFWAAARLSEYDETGPLRFGLTLGHAQRRAARA